MYGNAITPPAAPAIPLRNCRRLTFWLVLMPTALQMLTGDAEYTSHVMGGGVKRRSFAVCP